MEFGVLGPLQVLAGDGPVAVGRGQQRAVLALLLLAAPEAVSRDRLVDELWGERPPASAEHAIEVYVSRLRKLLRASGDDEDALRRSPAGYALEVDPDRIDARRFERLVGEARQAVADDPPRAERLFEEALALWRGEPLAEFVGLEFARVEADRLEEVRAGAVEGWVEARLERGEHGEVIGRLTGLVAANPLRERPRRLLMLALYRSGRHAEALSAYRDACAALDEIGLQPGPEIRQLEEAILRHDSSLGGPTPPATQHSLEDTTTGRGSSSASGLPAGVLPPEARPVAEPDVREAPAKRRKVVTAVFCDVTGFTALGEELDPEALHEVMSRYWRELRAVIERHGGAVDKFIGDALMAVFGIPRAHEDDALRAVRAAAEIRERLPAVADEVGVSLTFRTGVNTGLVLVGEGENLAIGDAVNVAARLEQAAAPGEILLGEETVRLVRDAVEVEPLEPLTLKGKSGPVRAFRLLGVDPRAPGIARRFEVPLVGRDREVGLLRAGWLRTVEESGCHLFTLLGAAGVGKSRLVAELFASLGDAACVLGGRCLPYGDGITFWPLIEALTPIGERAGEVLERLGSGGAALPEELYFDVRRLLEALAHDRPVILHFDDLQWAQPMLLDMLDHIADLSRGAPILLLCTARPELLEERPGWAGGKLNATTVLLEPLPREDCERLLDHLGDGLARDARARVIRTSDGNPLFLEEMVALAREHDVIAVPATIQALLTARLERLPDAERELLERGAVEGEVFHRTAVCALLGNGSWGEVEPRLAWLVRRELIRPHSATLKGDDAFRFRHLLIRDVAYDGLPKAARAELHDQFARWLEHYAPELPELEEIAGWHLEQTVRYRRELRREVDPTLLVHAARHLHVAGARAARRGDVAAATNLLERALALAPRDTPINAAVAVDLAERLIDIGDLARVDELLAIGESDASVSDLAALTRFEWMLRAEPAGAIPLIQSRLPPILERISRAGDPHGLAKAHMVAAAVQWLATLATPAGAEFRLVADHARDAGDAGLRSRALAQLVLTLIYGPADAATLATEYRALENEDLGPYLTAFVDLLRGELERLNDNRDEARRYTQRAIDGFGSLGAGAPQGGLEQDLGQLELSFDEPSRALAALLRSDAILAQLGERALRSTTQALIADAQERLGDRDAARAAIELSSELTADEDVLNDALTHRIQARLSLADGDHTAAESRARSAVQVACRTDFPRVQAQTRLDLASVLAATGNPQAAITEAHEALELYEAKGDKPGAAQARAFIQQHYSAK